MLLHSIEEPSDLPPEPFVRVVREAESVEALISGQAAAAAEVLAGLS